MITQTSTEKIKLVLAAQLQSGSELQLGLSVQVALKAYFRRHIRQNVMPLAFCSTRDCL